MPASSVGPKTLVKIDDPNNPGNSSNSTPGVFPPAKDVETDLAPDSVDDAVGLAKASGSKMVVVDVSNVPNNPVDVQPNLALIPVHNKSFDVFHTLTAVRHQLCKCDRRLAKPFLQTVRRLDNIKARAHIAL
jgi:hypothetical protein